MHFVLGFLTGLLVWLPILIIYRVNNWDFPIGPGRQFWKRLRGSRHIVDALCFGVLGGTAGLAVDIDYLLHQSFGLPYRFWHTPALILGSVLAVACIIYICRTVPYGRRVYTSLLVLVVALALVTHVLLDYLLGWF